MNSFSLSLIYTLLFSVHFVSLCVNTIKSSQDVLNRLKNSEFETDIDHELESNENNNDIDIDHRLLLSDPMTAALFATAVTQTRNFLTNHDCIEWWNTGGCERIKIAINNHFCNIILEKVDSFYYDLLEKSAENIISTGSGQSGGEFYGTYNTKGVIRYKIHINYYIYYLDFFWCIDCEYIYRYYDPYDFSAYGSDIKTISKDDLYGYGIALLSTNGYNTNDAFNCYENMFKQINKPPYDWFEDAYIPNTCGEFKGKYGPLKIYNQLAGTKTLIWDNAANGIGIKIKSEMTEISPRTLTIDVFPNKGTQSSGQYCPS